MTIKPKPLQGTSRTLDEWKEFARRDDCLDQMVPSDLRCILSAIEAVDTATIRAEALREAAAVIDRNDSAPCIPNEAWSDDQQNYYVSGQLDAATSWQHAILALIDKEQDR